MDCLKILGQMSLPVVDVGGVLEALAAYQGIGHHSTVQTPVHEYSRFIDGGSAWAGVEIFSLVDFLDHLPHKLRAETKLEDDFGESLDHYLWI